MRITLQGAGRQAHQLEQLQHARSAAARITDRMDDQRLGDDVAHPHARVQRPVRVLEHDLHGAAFGTHGGTAQPGDVFAVVQDGPAAGFDQAQQETPGG